MKRRKNIDEFKVPTNYFDEFENHLLNKINEEVLPEPADILKEIEKLENESSKLLKELKRLL